MRVSGNTTENRLEGFAAALLAQIKEVYGEQARLGDYAFVAEVDFEMEGEAATAVTFRASEQRPWVQAGLFRAAARLAEESYSTREEA